MKKTGAFFLSFLLLSVSAECAQPERALFVSVLQDPFVLSSQQEIEELVDFAKKHDVGTLFVQVYRSNKAWFPSTSADDRPYLECLRAVGEDPLALLIARAHSAGIEVHAWMNLLSLSANTEAPMLKRYGQGILTRKPSTGPSLEDHRVDRQFFLEPSDPRVRRSLSNAMGELLRSYPGLDGVQFDYIRYPDKDPFYGYSRLSQRRFHRTHPDSFISEDDKAWKDWRRSQVTALVKQLADKARRMRPGIQVSTTGLMPYSRATHESFQDWKHWLRGETADFVTLMCYAPDAAQFRRYIEDGRQNAGGLEKVILAVGAYRFTASPEIFVEQHQACEDSQARGCAILDYADLRKDPALAAVYR